MAWRLLACCALPAYGVLAMGSEDADYVAARRDMVNVIQANAGLTRDKTGKLAFDPRVLEVINQVPRHEFVPPPLRSNAYDNRPLPIGHGQTISQPYIVALMTDLLNVKPDGSVLEVGTGSGYQAAILARLVKRVYTIEIIPPLAEAATERLKRLGYTNVVTRSGDGYYGWKEHAPFDAIVVTAAAGHVPPPLIRQLKPGGRMVIPVGGGFFTQQLLLVEKTPDANITTRQILPVRFVPLTGKH